MRYFVIAPNGSKFGPADIPTLQAWVAQGRVVPNTVLEEEASRQRIEARFVAGLFGMEVQQLPPGPQYARPEEYSRSRGNGSSDVALSIICSAMSILCCVFFIFGGFMYASRAIAKGNRAGVFARWVAVLFAILWVVTTYLTIVYFKEVSKWIFDRVGVEAPF